MGVTLDHIHGQTYHGRHGSIDNAFRYSIDYVLCDLEGQNRLPFLFSRNRKNIMALHDRDHGGIRGSGTGIQWVRNTLKENDLEQFVDARIKLLAQPRVWGHVFNPVCFWLVFDDQDHLRVVIAEVNNTFGHRHSYLCYNDDFSEISKKTRLRSRKIFHVSPFQPVQGTYEFRFDIDAKKVGVWIDYKTKTGGVYATFCGRRQPLTNKSIVKSCIARPFGSMRVVALIYWQALKLKMKGAMYRSVPIPPQQEVSR